MLSAFAGEIAEHQRMFSHLTTSRESQTDVVLPSYSKEECGFGRSIFDLFFFLGCA